VDKGPFYGEKATAQRMKALFIEDLWGNYLNWVCGIYNSANVTVNVISYEGAAAIGNGDADAGSSWSTNWNKSCTPRNNVFMSPNGKEGGASESTYYGSASVHKSTDGGTSNVALDTTFIGCAPGNNYGAMGIVSTRANNLNAIIRLSYPR